MGLAVMGGEACAADGRDFAVQAVLCTFGLVSICVGACGFPKLEGAAGPFGTVCGFGVTPLICTTAADAHSTPSPSATDASKRASQTASHRPYHHRRCDRFPKSPHQRPTVSRQMPTG